MSLCVWPTGLLPDLQVRKAMAEHMYVNMLALQSDAESDAITNNASVQFCSPDAPVAADGLQQLCAEDLEAGLDVLLLSAWDGPLDEVRASREALATALNIVIRTRRLARPLSEADTSKAVGQESYQSLLDDAARGGGY